MRHGWDSEHDPPSDAFRPIDAPRIVRDLATGMQEIFLPALFCLMHPCDYQAAMKASLDNPAVVDRLCARIAAGEGIVAICRDEDMPDGSTVYLRMTSDPDFSTRIARAREAQQDAEAEKCVTLADEATPENWQVKRLQIATRQWRAAKLAPKKYGDRQQLDVRANVSFDALLAESLDQSVDKK